jgi:CheY-like chemotaxis protein
MDVCQARAGWEDALGVSSARILLVDDDDDTRRLFAMALRSLGDVVQAPNGVAAIDHLSKSVFDIVILDLHMPNVDGFAVLERLAEPSSSNKSTPVIVATADTTGEARARALRSRSVYFISKPVPLKVLTELVRETLNQAASRTSRVPKG